MLNTFHSEPVKVHWLKAIETNSDKREEVKEGGAGGTVASRITKTKETALKNLGSFMDLGGRN